MNQRSQMLMRSKQELKNQLLMGFRKKNRHQNGNYQQTQTKSMNQIYQTPLNNSTNQKNSFIWQNKSVLDQFSRCPVRQDQYQYTGQMVLKKFMIAKDRPIFPNKSTKPSVSVQTQKNIEGFQIPSQKLLSKTIGRTKQYPYGSKTPPKVANFDLKLDKSIIDVSGNLENVDFPTIGNRKQQNNKILTDSILGGLQNQNHQDSAQQLLKQLEGGRKDKVEKDQSFKFIKTKSELELVQKKQPEIKKIQLSKYKNNKQEEIQLSKNTIKQDIKENKSYNQNINQYNDEDQRDQKIQKLLSKKNVIKSMILNKDNQKQVIVKENVLPNSTITTSKWSKLQKRKSEQENIKLKQKQKIFQLQQEVDPLDLLLPYETSSSGLQAVIQQQNESQLQESVKPKNLIEKTIGKDQIKKKKEQNQMIINKSKSKGMQMEKQYRNNKKQPSQNSIKQISIADLSLEDVSQIENASQNKKLPDSFKKLRSFKDINSSQLPQYQDSQCQQHEKSKIDMQKYIVNDIANDIETLKKKISSQGSFSLQEKKLKKIASKGSEGPDKKMSSMLDFFDQVHDKLNLAQICKDIIDLRDKIANQSE